VSAHPVAAGRVLPTLNEDGSRNWIRPKPSPGTWWRRRQVVAYVLMVVFVAIPHIRIGGKPAFLMSFPKREFNLMGWTFLPTDTLLFMLFLFSSIIGIFLLTALFGRAWCGWACPQTVYLEFLFRPIERLFEGGYAGSRKLDREGKFWGARRVAKYAVYAVLSLFLAHTFLAYFVGTEQLAVWVTQSPWDQPTGFVVMAITTIAIWYNFTYFREQTCLIACPYGRWQSVLLDKQSIIVAYDYLRGEPRGKGTEPRPDTMGDCIDCKACVTTCPTGIDIRNGLQMECVHCTQCIDACDAIMDKVGKPRGLIRYSSQEALAGKPRKLLRVRTVLYPLAFTLALSTMLVLLFNKETADVTVLRGLGAPFTEEADGTIANQVRIKIANRGDADARYTITLDGANGGRVISPENPLVVAEGATRETSIFVLLPRDGFANGERAVTITVSDGARFTTTVPWRLQGPSDGNGGTRTSTPATTPDEAP
jgi:cytochrome c oxidase accessory protein FixG